jgi:hypothetical protein
MITSLPAAGVGINLGPLNFFLGGGAVVEERDRILDPICQAIAHRNLIEVILVVQENSDKSEWKRFVVEPYALGFDKDERLILKGFHVESFEVADIPDERDEAEPSSGSGFVSGVYTIFKSSSEMRSFKVHKIESIRVMADTNFEVREEAFDENESSNGTIVEMICEVL